MVSGFISLLNSAFFYANEVLTAAISVQLHESFQCDYCFIIFLVVRFQEYISCVCTVRPKMFRALISICTNLFRPELN